MNTFEEWQNILRNQYGFVDVTYSQPHFFAICPSCRCVEVYEFAAQSGASSFEECGSCHEPYIINWGI